MRKEDKMKQEKKRKNTTYKKQRNQKLGTQTDFVLPRLKSGYFLLYQMLKIQRGRSNFILTRA